MLTAGRQRWPVSARGLRVGRSSKADAQLDDPHVSRLQVELVQDGAALLVRALESKNPTLVDGRPLAGEVRLEGREHTLQLGQTELRIGRE
ncbi:MAG: FHA domain-containing protein [Myxococcota bacterium]